jgi:hypothetical protein
MRGGSRRGTGRPIVPPHRPPAKSPRAPADTITVGNPFTSYSAQARLLPYIEQSSLFQLVNLFAPYASQPAVTQQRIPTYICPSELRDEPKPGTPINYPISYGVNVGTWLVFDPNTCSAETGRSGSTRSSPSRTSPTG